MKKHIDRYAALVLGVAVALGFLWSQRPHPKGRRWPAVEAAPSRRVTAAIAEEREVAAHADGVGTVRSRRQTQIAARVLSEVREILKQPGDAVAAGEVLIRLDDRELASRVAQAEATLESAKEALAEAQTDFDRKKNLLEKDAVTKQEFDLARFALSGATARRQAAGEALEEAKIQLGYATIKAPFAGVVFEKHADPGDLALAGKPLLGLYDPTQLRLEALVEEALLWRLKLKDELRVDIDALTESVVGQVSEAVPAVDPSTRTGTVKIDLATRPELRPGMFGRARIPVGSRKAVLVPPSALVRRGQVEMVFALEEDAAAKTTRARLRIVRAGGIVAESAGGAAAIEILSGLSPKTRIAKDGVEDLRDGEAVEVVEAAAGGEARP